MRVSNLPIRLRTLKQTPLPRSLNQRPLHHRPYNPPTPPPLLPHTCLITGGSSGLGRAIALEFARQGANTTIIGRNAAALADTTEKCRYESAGLALEKKTTHSFIVGDVADQEFWERLGRGEGRLRGDGEGEVEYHPNITTLINAAGITHSTLFMRQSPSDITSLIQTNLMGTAWACRYLSKHLVKARPRPSEDKRDAWGPSIVNVASFLGFHGGSGAAAYAASKAGVIGLTRALAGELGPLGVRVNAIVPGYIDTAMTQDLSPAARTKIEAKIPLKRFGEAEEVADAASFLVRNLYANNCVLNLDGGLSAATI